MVKMVAFVMYILSQFKSFKIEIKKREKEGGSDGGVGGESHFTSFLTYYITPYF